MATVTENGALVIVTAEDERVVVDRVLFPDVHEAWEAWLGAEAASHDEAGKWERLLQAADEYLALVGMGEDEAEDVERATDDDDLSAAAVAGLGTEDLVTAANVAIERAKVGMQTGPQPPTPSRIATISDVYAVVQRQTQALKDIINAADNGQPYSPEDLARVFGRDYNAGYELLAEFGLPEGDGNPTKASR